MLRNNKGITLIALIIMIIVLLILTSIFVATSLDALNETEKSEIQSEMHALEQAVSERYTSYIKNGESSRVELVGLTPIWPTASECVGAIKVAMKYEDSDRINRVSGEISRDYEKYVKIIDANEAKKLGIDNLNKDYQYVVDYYTSAVYGPIK